MAEQATGWGETASLQRHNAAARSDHSSCEKPRARPELDLCGSRILSAAGDLVTFTAVMPGGCLFLPGPTSQQPSQDTYRYHLDPEELQGLLARRASPLKP
jgi:hypothetical protein